MYFVLCSCTSEVDAPSHFFLHYFYFMDIWKTFFTEIESVISKISQILKIVKLLQAGSKIKFFQNCSIFKFTRSIIKLERFSGSILLKNAA